MNCVKNITLAGAVALMFAGCGRQEVRPPMRALEIPVRFVMAGDACEGRIEKKDNDEAYVSQNGRITWRVVENACGPVNWDVSDFKKKSFGSCSLGKDADDNFPPETPGNPAVVKVRRAGTWTGTFCYELKAQWNNRDIDVDPELDVLF